MRYHFLLLTIICFLCSSCHSTKNDVISIDISTAKDVYLEDIAEGIEVIPLQTNGEPIGVIFSGKCYGDDYFFHSFAERHIYYFKSGQYVNTLKAVGRGPGEYVCVQTFCYLPKSQTLIVYDLNGRKMQLYEIPTMVHKRTITLDWYIMGMEAAGDNKVIVSGCPIQNQDRINIVAYFDLESKEFTEIRSISELAGRADFDLSFTYNDEEVLYSWIGPKYKFCSVKEGKLNEEFLFDFGKNNYPKQYLEDNPPIMYLNVTSEFENNKVGSPKLLIKNRNAFSFWFSYSKRREANKMIPFRLCHYSLNVSSTFVAKSIGIKGLSIDLQPIAASEGYYYSLIEDEQKDLINHNETSSSIGDQIIDALTDGMDNSLILVKYRIRP